MWIGHHKEIQISSRWPIHIINPVDKTKLSYNTLHQHNTTVSLETYPLYDFLPPWRIFWGFLFLGLHSKYQLHKLAINSG